jgi:hypothetical protein
VLRAGRRTHTLKEWKMSLSTLFKELRTDPWREEVGFSAEINAAHDVLFGRNPADKQHEALNAWVERFQPCLFGKIAAKLRAIRFCVVNEGLVETSDEAVYDAIRAARLRWKKDAIHGKASAFVIVLAAPSLAAAVPDDTVRAIAIRLASLYLEKEIEVDQVYQERVFLETPGAHSGWVWRGGVDYFAAHGDGRWWQDHRFPGGIAFSVNSLGHLVRCAQVSKALEQFDATLGLTTDDEINRPRLESNARALEFAMRTIRNSTDAISGKAAILLRSTDPRPATCPVLSSDFDAFDVTKYDAYYDTDFTLRSEFFRPDVQRPSSVGTHTMNFTYIYDDSFENFDHAGMMHGVQYKGDAAGAATQRRTARVRTMTPEPVSLDNDSEFKSLLE